MKKKGEIIFGEKLQKKKKNSSQVALFQMKVKLKFFSSRSFNIDFNQTLMTRRSRCNFPRSFQSPGLPERNFLLLFSDSDLIKTMKFSKRRIFPIFLLFRSFCRRKFVAKNFAREKDSFLELLTKKKKKNEKSSFLFFSCFSPNPFVYLYFQSQ